MGRHDECTDFIADTLITNILTTASRCVAFLAWIYSKHCSLVIIVTLKELGKVLNEKKVHALRDWQFRTRTRRGSLRVTWEHPLHWGAGLPFDTFRTSKGTNNGENWCRRCSWLQILTATRALTVTRSIYKRFSYFFRFHYTSRALKCLAYHRHEIIISSWPRFQGDLHCYTCTAKWRKHLKFDKDK